MGADAELIGRVIAGRFRITDFVGEGAMAAVYRGVQEGRPPSAARPVAIKVMHRHLASDTTFVRRFRREAKAASRLRHPNTVTIFDYGVDHGLAYIAMELLKGRDLFELIKEGPVPGPRAAGIMMQVCDALVTAHGRGILHRDLKPENVMLLDGQGPDRVKVLDFGIAKLVAPEERLEDAPTSITGSGLTSVGAVLGTPEYMSPEQCQGGRLDFRSDIYACGVLLYQLVTTQVPFTGETPVHTMLRHVREPPKPPRSLAPHLPPALEAVILRALEKRADDRHASALELGAALAQAIGRSDAWKPYETLAPGEYALAGTPTPAGGTPQLGHTGVVLPRNAQRGVAPESSLDETVRDAAPPEDATIQLHAQPLVLPPAQHPVASAPATSAPIGPPTPPYGVMQQPPGPHLGGPTPPGAYPIRPAAHGQQVYGGGQQAPPPVSQIAVDLARQSAGLSPAEGSGAFRPGVPSGQANAEERSLAFYAITFAVVFMVVLVTLTMIVFR